MTSLIKFLRFTNNANYSRAFYYNKGQVLCSQLNYGTLGNDRRCMSTKSKVRIGCASGFWGDTAVAGFQLVHGGKLDFLVLDYLSEITMSLLSAAKQKVPTLGYAPDFVMAAVGPHLKAIKKKGIRVISNAGGINPQSCALAMREAAQKAGVELKIATVTGDDIFSQKAELEKRKVRDMFSGLALPPTTTSMTAYFGAAGIHKALDMGADIVITGRCTDSALVLAPLIHSFNWLYDDYDLLAAGSLAGHLIECGAQSTGGIFTDWHKVNKWENIGFPIVEVSGDGRFILTKPEGSGGEVSPGTVGEQLVYEIGDPRAYALPDVVCDFSNVTIKTVTEGESVLVEGARGFKPSDQYKVSATYAEGYRLTASCVVIGTRAADKARKTCDAILNRVRTMYSVLGLKDFTNIHVQILGAEDSYGPHANPNLKCRESVVWMAAHHTEKRALEILAREIAPAGTGMAPGLCAIVGGRPKVSPVLKLFSFLHPKSECEVVVEMNGDRAVVGLPNKLKPVQPAAAQSSPNVNKSQEPVQTSSFSYRLEDLAYARSGDKGNTCNIGVIAREPHILPYLKHQLTEQAVFKYFHHLFEDDEGKPLPSGDYSENIVKKYVTRYELPGISGLNFLLHNSLGGGGIASLRADPQGKAYAQMLLDFEIKNVPDLIKNK